MFYRSCSWSKCRHLI